MFKIGDKVRVLKDVMDCPIGKPSVDLSGWVGHVVEEYNEDSLDADTVRVAFSDCALWFYPWELEHEA